MVQNERALRDYALPSLKIVQESIARLTIIANSFEIKPAMVQMIQNNLQFRGTMTEDPNKHLKRLLQLYDTFMYNRAPGPITTWDELPGKFLQKLESARSRLDGAVGGALINRTYEDAYEIIGNMALDSCQWPTERFTYGQKIATVKVIQEDGKY
ncbi:Integrase-like protein [Gossypium australe]|uniref:Integrase-like protein n=1 Tax=Gossypium australe TaxID=47621 RepID=A0A5B6UX93_9ROSI|nr:Integrase-like protein [Gossypium australe]